MSSIALLHVARRDLGLDDDDYRAVLERVTGKRSAKDLSEAERNLVADEFRRLGFKPSSKGRKKGLEGKYAAKLQALWIAGWNLGVVRNRTDTALLAFVRRQTGVDHTRFLHHADDAARAIEALKGWLARDAGVDWGQRTERFPGDYINQPQYRIACAQWAIMKRDLPPDGEWEPFLSEPDWHGLYRYAAVFGVTEKFERFEAEDWHRLTNALGRAVRDARKKG